jgi:hypothetical protein
MKAMILSLGLLVAGCGVVTDGATAGGDDVGADLIGGACGATTQIDDYGFGEATQAYAIWTGSAFSPVPDDLQQRCQDSAFAAQVVEEATVNAKANFASRANQDCASFTCPARCGKQCMPPEPTLDPSYFAGGVNSRCSISDRQKDDTSNSYFVNCECNTTVWVKATWDASCVVARAVDGPRTPSPRQSLVSTTTLTVQ